VNGSNMSDFDFDFKNLPQAKPMTQEEFEDKAKVAYNLEEAIKARIREGQEVMINLAQAVYEFHEQGGWAYLGYDIGDAGLCQWLAQPDVGFTRSQWFRLRARWYEFVVLRGQDVQRLAMIDQSKLDVILPAVKAHRVTLQTALDDAESLGWRDLRERYGKGKVWDDPSSRSAATSEQVAPDDDEPPPPDLNPQPASEATWLADADPELGEPIEGTATEVRPPEAAASAATSTSEVEISEDVEIPPAAVIPHTVLADWLDWLALGDTGRVARRIRDLLGVGDIEF
jgi:hypothetical protein